MSLQPFTLFSFNISACGFVLVGPQKNNNFIFSAVIREDFVALVLRVE